MKIQHIVLARHFDGKLARVVSADARKTIVIIFVQFQLRAVKLAFDMGFDFSAVRSRGSLVDVDATGKHQQQNPF